MRMNSLAGRHFRRRFLQIRHVLPAVKLIRRQTERQSIFSNRLTQKNPNGFPQIHFHAGCNFSCPISDDIVHSNLLVAHIPS